MVILVVILVEILVVILLVILVEMAAGDVDEDDLDVFALKDVCNIGKGKPLFANFEMEDWALLNLRFELHILAHAFRRDVKDPERVGIHLDHLVYYYNKYFHKQLAAANYGVENYEDLVVFVKDTVTFNSQKVLTAHVSDELDNFDVFLKLTEEGRRERLIQADLGDESAVLKFSQAALTPPTGAGGGRWTPGWSSGGNWNNRPYQRGPRPPYQARPYVPQDGHQQQQRYGNSQPPQKGGSFSAGYNAGGGGGGGYKGGPPAGKGYEPRGYAPPVGQSYGPQRPYQAKGKGGYGYGK